MEAYAVADITVSVANVMTMQRFWIVPFHMNILGSPWMEDVNAKVDYGTHTLVLEGECGASTVPMNPRHGCSPKVFPLQNIQDVTSDILMERAIDSRIPENSREELKALLLATPTVWRHAELGRCTAIRRLL